MRIHDELVRDAGVEVLVTFRRLLKIDHLDIYDLGDGQSVPEYRLHELPIVFEHRSLPGMERVRFCPAETKAKTEVAVFGSLLLRARIVGHIQAGNADSAGCPGDFHQTVEHDGRRFDDFAVCSLRLRFKADAVDRGINFWNAEDVSNEFAETIVPGEVDRLEADFLGVSEPLLVHVADQHGRRAKDARGRGRRKADRPCPGDVDPIRHRPWR